MNPSTASSSSTTAILVGGECVLWDVSERFSNEDRTAASAVRNAAISSLHSLSDARSLCLDSSAVAVCVASERFKRSFSSFKAVVSSTNADAASAYSASFAAAAFAAAASAPAIASRTASSSRSGVTRPAILASASTRAVSLAAASCRVSRAVFSAASRASSSANFFAFSAFSAFAFAFAAALAAAAAASASSRALPAFALLASSSRPRLLRRHQRLTAIWHATIERTSFFAWRLAMNPRAVRCKSTAARDRVAAATNASLARRPRASACTVTIASRVRMNAARAARPRACFCVVNAAERVLPRRSSMAPTTPARKKTFVDPKAYSPWSTPKCASTARHSASAEVRSFFRDACPCPPSFPCGFGRRKAKR
mmetsp:Transcript_6537/g.29508  ORF Transcript_6537/g.29508 Transcript_6537/m.29508 type:complete len:370 (-) Transcript_6537:501-1610(-)